MAMNFLEHCKFDWMELLNFRERPFRAKLIPSKVWKDLDNYRNDSIGLMNYCRKWRTKVAFLPPLSKAKFYAEYVAVGGLYESDTRQSTIEIHSNNFNKHEFTPRSWDAFKFRFIQTLMHEMIHFMQYERRSEDYNGYYLPHKKTKSVKKNETRKYFSDYDEIQAYAHCILIEYYTNRPNIPVADLVARCKTKRDSRTFGMILKAFDNNFRGNEALPKLTQHILKWDRKYHRVAKLPK